MVKNLSYKLVFEETEDSIFITDGLSAKIIDVNKAGSNLLGYKKEELLDKPLYDFLDNLDAGNESLNPNKISMYDSVISNKVIKTKTGKTIPVDMTINTLDDEGGNHVMTTLRDVSERISYNKRIVEMNEELIKANTSKDKFFSIIAHDLKNPISAIIGLTEIITNESGEINQTEINEFLAMISDLSKNTNELLDNLLNWSRLQTKNIQLEKEHIDIAKLVNKIVELLKPSADLKHIKLENKLDTGSKIYADENMINTVIRNLVSNSIKFSPEFSTVSIKLGYHENNSDISVKDEGVGMEENYIAKLFESDLQTSRLGTNNEKGTGLGLVLCNEFVKLHNGSIEVLSEINKGTEFIIKLPKEK